MNREVKRAAWDRAKVFQLSLGATIKGVYITLNIFALSPFICKLIYVSTLFL